MNIRLNTLLVLDTKTNSLLNQLYHYDKLSFEHSLRVGKLMDRAVRILPLEEDIRQEWVIAALLHDIGKLVVPRKILNKSKVLSDKERNLLLNHCLDGYKILNDLDYSDTIIKGTFYHHERLDGSGYPKNLVGSEIPDIAQMLAVLDSYDAMCNDRPYKRAYPRLLAERELLALVDDKFNKQYVNILRQVKI